MHSVVSDNNLKKKCLFVVCACVCACMHGRFFGWWLATGTINETVAQLVGIICKNIVHNLETLIQVCQSLDFS